MVLYKAMMNIRKPESYLDDESNGQDADKATAAICFFKWVPLHFAQWLLNSADNFNLFFIVISWNKLRIVIISLVITSVLP